MGIIRCNSLLCRHEAQAHGELLWVKISTVHEDTKAFS